jgi:hypothetical protein
MKTVRERERVRKRVCVCLSENEEEKEIVSRCVISSDIDKMVG